MNDGSVNFWCPDIQTHGLLMQQRILDDLLNAGVEIYLYRKGFVHAKTMIADTKIAIVRTANMNYRSFDLNFEVNAIVCDEEISNELRNVFLML